MEPTDNVVSLFGGMDGGRDAISATDELVRAALRLAGMVEMVIHTSGVPGLQDGPTAGGEAAQAIYEASQRLRIIALRTHVTCGKASSRSLAELQAAIGVMT